MRYFIGKDGKQLGPFDAQEVREQLQAGAIGYDDLVWREGLAAWAPVRSEFPPLAVPPLPPPMPAPTPHVGVPPAPAFTPNAKPHLRGAGATSADHGPVLAERGRRAIAASIDHLLVMLCLIPGLVRFIPLFSELVAKTIETNQQPNEAAVERMLVDSFGQLFILLLIVGLVQGALLSLRGQTLGKLLCGIRIVRLDGRRAGFLHAFLLRSVLFSGFAFIPFVGLVVVGIIDPLMIFREDRRCLHDLLSGTAVVDV